MQTYGLNKEYVQGMYNSAAVLKELAKAGYADVEAAKGAKTPDEILWNAAKRDELLMQSMYDCANQARGVFADSKGVDAGYLVEYYDRKKKGLPDNPGVI